MSERLKVKAGDATLAVQIDGDAKLPWLILSNSLATDMTIWAPQMDMLSNLRRVVRYDTRGHGESSAPAGPYGFDHLTGDVVAIMDHFHIASADVMGISLGGMTMLGLGLDHPDRVRRVICCDARGEFPPPGIAAWDQRLEAVLKGGLSAIVDDTLARWFTPATHQERPDLIAHARRMILATSEVGYRGCVAALKTLDYLRRLPNLKKQTLYIVGEEDSGAPVAAMRAMEEATPGSKLIIAPAAAHIANMENPEAFNAAVRGFLA